MKTFQVLGSALVITSTTDFLITNSASISGNLDPEALVGR